MLSNPLISNYIPLKKFKSHFKFNKQERSGIFFLLLGIVILQAVYFFFKAIPFEETRAAVFVDSDGQAKIDALREQELKKDTVRMYPFNPNFITDFRGYTLGMSLGEIDRLHAFRSQNKYVNSADEFQKITLVSDSLLHLMSPYFKFPEWTRNRNKQYSVGSTSKILPSRKGSGDADAGVRGVKDINSATAQDLKAINGIGEILSVRIIKFRDRLGGFLVNEQLYDVYGAEPEVVERMLGRFKVLTKPDIQKININTASIQEISGLVYIKYKIAAKIVAYRENVGSIGSFDELTKIEDFPADKIDRIELYLTL